MLVARRIVFDERRFPFKNMQPRYVFADGRQAGIEISPNSLFHVTTLSFSASAAGVSRQSPLPPGSFRRVANHLAPLLSRCAPTSSTVRVADGAPRHPFFSTKARNSRASWEHGLTTMPVMVMMMEMMSRMMPVVMAVVVVPVVMLLRCCARLRAGLRARRRAGRCDREARRSGLTLSCQRRQQDGSGEQVDEELFHGRNTR